MPPPPRYHNDTKSHHDKSNILQKLITEISNIRILEVSSPIGSYFNLGSMQYEIFLQHCIGDYLLFMDLSSDCVHDALAMLDYCNSYDIVIATRQTKQQNIMQKIASKAFYKTLAIFAKGVREDYSEFCVISRKTINTLLSNQHDIKLLRLLHFDKTLSIYEYPILSSSTTKRKFLDSINLWLDIIFGESYRLLRFSSCMCLTIACANAFYMVYILYTYFFLSHVASGWASTSLYMVVMNIGLFLTLSILGEYMRIMLLKLKGAIPYEIIDEKSSVVIDFQEKNIETL